MAEVKRVMGYLGPTKDTVTITIKATMKERWVDDFLSFLRYMETCGNLGHSAVLGFYADGDGDFRPKFVFDREFSETTDQRLEETNERYKHATIEPEIVYDAK